MDEQEGLDPQVSPEILFSDWTQHQEMDYCNDAGSTHEVLNGTSPAEHASEQKAPMTQYQAFPTPPQSSGSYYPFSATPSPAGSPSGGAHGYSQAKSSFRPRYNSSGYYATTPRTTNCENSSARKRDEVREPSSPAYYRMNEESDQDHEKIEVDETKNLILDSQPSKQSQQYHWDGTRQNYQYKENDTTPKRPTQSSSKQPPKAPSVPKATEADAKRHKIPPGYSLKNWDRAEEPIMLLGSIFDANSLEKWIYDLTVYHHGPETPVADMAEELWLLALQLAGKIKRAEDCMPRRRREENQELMDDFIESEERLTDKLKKLLKACENPMPKAGKRGGDPSKLGKNAGIEFVDSIFGRDRQLEATEKFMASIRLWNMRIDVNCEDLLRRAGE